MTHWFVKKVGAKTDYTINKKGTFWKRIIDKDIEEGFE